MSDDDKKKNGAAKGPPSKGDDGAGDAGGESTEASKDEPKKASKDEPKKDEPKEASKDDDGDSGDDAADDEAKGEDEDEAPAEPPKAAAKEAKGKASSPWARSKDGDSAAAAKTAEPEAKAEAEAEEEEWPKAAWGAPLARIDKKWTRIEARLAWYVLVLEIATLCFAIFLSGMSSGSDGAAKNGLVLRGILGATALGIAAHFASRKHKHHTYVVTAAIVVGALLGPLWANKGVAYFGNFRGWLQTASILSLFGGVSNLAKRLTIWLALLGASVATAQGKHINVDVAMRFLTPKTRVPVALVGWLAGAIVCFAAVWGFVDQIAIENFKIEESRACPDDPNRACKIPTSERLGRMGHEMRRDLFLAGRQVSLDARSIPKVLAGDKFDGYLTPAEWNTWVRESEFTRYFPENDVKGLYAPEGSDVPRSPIVVIPGAVENIQELLIRELNLIFPFGFLMIGLRFVLRALLALSGHVKVDPNAAHADDDDHALEHEPQGGAK